MKRLLTPCVLGVAVAAGGTACVKGVGTSPDPVPSGPAARWTGTARFAYELVSSDDYGDSSSTRSFDVVNITWVKDPNPSPAPPAGGARYVVESGAVHVSWRNTVAGRGYRCTGSGDGDFPLPIANPPNPDRQGLELGPDGRYQGTLYASFQVTVLVLCQGLESYITTKSAGLELDITGTLDGGRMRGDMTQISKPEGHAITTHTKKGSWDFAPN